MSNIKYPTAFLQRMQTQLGNGFDTFIETLNGSSPTSIRLNPYKKTAQFDAAAQVPWCTNGKYLAERPSFTFDPLFHAGTYYVQEAGSMYVEQAYKLANADNKPVRVLDMCAAPGGKSTHLLSLMGSDSLLVSNEIVPNRNKILQENITKWGTANTVVTQNKPEDFNRLKNFFDIILIDAPCSGEGLFRKDKDAIGEWSEDNVAMCSTRQKDILLHAYNALKPGGYIIYSTCTYEAVENDENVQYAETLGMQQIALPKVETGIASTDKGLQFYPHLVQSEGFYISLLQKHSTEEYDSIFINPKQIDSSSNTDILAKYLDKPEQFNAISKGDMLIALPKNIQRQIQAIGTVLNVRHSGVLLGNYKGKDFLPAHDIAINIHVNQSIPAVELNKEDAITFLRSEPVKANTSARGWCIAKHEGHNLGWLKVMDNRSNNYYPKEWRILKR
ncbi:MAG: RNA methyltransferase [Bacteroidetes bacterium]|nr:RNA methyltransferase [Bacteroidota bacterium]